MRKVSLIFSCLLVFTLVSPFYAQQAPEAGMPTGPGCYAKCLIPDQYETITEEVLIKEASSRTEIVAGGTETLSQEVLAKEGSTQLRAIPAQFEDASEQVLRADGASTVVINPATFETVSQEVLSKAAFTQLAVVPAQFETQSEEILKADGSSSVRITPAQFETMTEQVMVNDGTSEVRITPAQFETSSQEVLASEGSSDVRITAASFETVSSQVIANTHGGVSYGSNATTLENVNFESGSAILTGSSRTELTNLAARVCGDGSSFKIVGHTDSQGNDNSNLTLSRNRAKAVYDALVAAGCSSANVSYEGRGEASPVADNATASGR